MCKSTEVSAEYSENCQSLNMTKEKSDVAAVINEEGEMSLRYSMLRSLDFVCHTGLRVPLMNFERNVL